VAVNYHSDRGGAERTASEIAELGGRAFTVQANVGASAEVDEMFAGGRRVWAADDLVTTPACRRGRRCSS